MVSREAREVVIVWEVELRGTADMEMAKLPRSNQVT